jgi:hypothetical protein
MGAPTSSYATGGIALRVSGALKPHHHDKVETTSVGFFKNPYTRIVPNSKTCSRRWLWRTHSSGLWRRVVHLCFSRTYRLHLQCWRGWACHLLFTGFFLRLLLNPKNWDSYFSQISVDLNPATQRYDPEDSFRHRFFSVQNQNKKTFRFLAFLILFYLFTWSFLAGLRKSEVA